jgi:predicted ATPase
MYRIDVSSPTDMADVIQSAVQSVKFLRLRMTNFLSYRSATLNFGKFTALVGPNGAGKSNAVTAVKLLRDIPIYGLQTALARRGGFDQLRHRSLGRPYDPALRIEFSFDKEPTCYYELRFSSVAGKRYEVKRERAEINLYGNKFSFISEGGILSYRDDIDGAEDTLESGQRKIIVVPGQSALSAPGGLGAYFASEVLQRAQTLEINPARVGELQEPSSIQEFEPDGSNIASINAMSPVKYVKPTWQPRLANRADVAKARLRSPSLERLVTKFDFLRSLLPEDTET